MNKATPGLTSKILEVIDGYLQGSVSGPDVAKWALDELTVRRPRFGLEDAAIEDALVALSVLHDQNERFDTTREELEFFRDCLLGKREYETKTTAIYKRKAARGGH